MDARPGVPPPPRAGQRPARRASMRRGARARVRLAASQELAELRQRRRGRAGADVVVPHVEAVPPDRPEQHPRPCLARARRTRDHVGGEDSRREVFCFQDDWLRNLG
eukprot:7300260-Pyramimonas_sp.AAC.1